MAKLIVFNSVSIDGYFTDRNGDMSWAYNRDPDWDEFTAANASGGGTLVFGRITYQMMANYWPSEAALKAQPSVARAMNAHSKLVFSQTLKDASWSNTRLVKTDPAQEIRKLKSEDGPGMAVLGSGTIVAQLAQARLIDELQLVVVPIAIGAGRTLFDGITERLRFKLIPSRAFKNGNVVNTYSQ